MLFKCKLMKTLGCWLNLKRDGLEKGRKRIELRAFLPTTLVLLSKLLRIPKLLAPNALLVPLNLLIRSKCITILYRNLSLFIDIFHVTMMFLCCFGLFYAVCNFPVPKQQTHDSAVKSGR